MNNIESQAMLRRLINHAERGSNDWCGWHAELLGHECAMRGHGYRGTVFSQPWLQRRYQQGYDEAKLRKQVGEITLSPLEVVLLTEAYIGA